MNDEENWWVGNGATPRKAVTDLTPDEDQPGIVWVEGVYSVPDRSVSRSESINVDITVIYESRPPKQWNVEVLFEDGQWRANLGGGKRI